MKYTESHEWILYPDSPKSEDFDRAKASGSSCLSEGCINSILPSEKQLNRESFRVGQNSQILASRGMVKKSTGRVGISAYAQKELGDVVYIQLPKIGQRVEAGEEVAILESTKAAADIYSPVSGEITAINQNLLENTHLLNTSPENEGWLYEIALSDASELDSLLGEEQYHQMIS